MIPMSLNRADPAAGSVLTLAVVCGLLTSIAVMAFTLIGA